MTSSKGAEIALLWEKDQIAVRQRIDQYTVGDDTRECSDLLPAREIGQERVERERRKRQRLNGQNEAPGKYYRNMGAYVFRNTFQEMCGDFSDIIQVLN